MQRICELQNETFSDLRIKFLVRCCCVAVDTIEQQFTNSSVIPAKMSPMILPKTMEPGSPMVGPV